MQKKISITKQQYEDAMLCIGKQRSLHELIEKAPNTASDMFSSVGFVYDILSCMLGKNDSGVVSFTQEDFEEAVEESIGMTVFTEDEEQASAESALALTVMYLLFTVSEFEEVNR